MTLKGGLESLRKIQRETACKVIIKDSFDSPLEIVAGVDLAFLGEDGVAACVAMDHPPKQVVETQSLVISLVFPCISTFLMFREGPPMIKVMTSLRTKVSIFLINGQGIAHPVGCGIVSHIGVDIDKPTIGVTSNRLVGEYDHDPKNTGKAVPPRYKGKMVGWVLKSRSGSGPIFVSPGHRVGLDSSLKIVKECLLGHRLPEPLEMAHASANQEKRRLISTRI